MADWHHIAQEPAENLESNSVADNLAYVIYTSGSTGRPKGVAIEHRSAVALIHWSRSIVTPEDLAGVLAATSICFDLSVFELFVPLSWGGHVILARDALQLPELPAAGEVRLVNTVPSAMAELVRSGGIPASVRTVNLAGEPLQHALVQQIYRQETIGRVINLYGPTEDTTYSTFALVRKGAQEAPTIGRPIDNTQVYLLDARLQPVPIGVPGELYLGGAGLARGYLNRPDLTAERFVPNPFLKDEGLRMKDEESRFILHPSSFRLYRTGDLARYRPDGTIEYLGRLDHQVKLRGFRIELGEIEAVLAQHQAVREALVLARGDVVGEKRLVAYVVPTQEPRTKNQEQRSENQEPRTENQELRSEQPDSQFSILNSQFSIQELRIYLKQRLPDYMVPSAFVLMDALPLTPNGKVDRKALPAPEGEQLRGGRDFAAPRSPLERELASLWAALLGVERVGLHDNFFELGGHSLLATRIVHRVRESYQVDPPLQAFFEEPTVSGLAALVEQRRAEAPAHTRPQIRALPRGGKSAVQVLAEVGRLTEDNARTLLDEKESAN